MGVGVIETGKQERITRRFFLVIKSLVFLAVLSTAERRARGRVLVLQ